MIEATLTGMIVSARQGGFSVPDILRFSRSAVSRDTENRAINKKNIK